MVTTGQKAPDFIAPVVQDGEGAMLELFTAIENHEAVVLVFAPAAFVPTCTAELVAIQEAGWHTRSDLAVIGLSGDSMFSHAAYADQYGLGVPLVADFHGGIADSYGLVLDDWEGHGRAPARAAVVLDSDWTVQALERAEPLAETTPAPVERVTDALGGLGIDVARPSVSYDF